MGDTTEDTIIEFTTSGSIDGPYNPARRMTIPAGTSIEDAILVQHTTSYYLWVKHISGPECAIFTAKKVNGKLTQVGGGRNCPRNEKDDSGGFYQWPYEIYAVGGRTCESLGIPLCTGWCW